MKKVTKFLALLAAGSLGMGLTVTANASEMTNDTQMRNNVTDFMDITAKRLDSIVSNGSLYRSLTAAPEEAVKGLNITLAPKAMSQIKKLALDREKDRLAILHGHSAPVVSTKTKITGVNKVSQSSNQIQYSVMALTTIALAGESPDQYWQEQQEYKITTDPRSSVITDLFCDNFNSLDKQELAQINANRSKRANLPEIQAPAVEPSKETFAVGRTAIVTYAKNWYASHNPDYPFYGDEDCTNFTSQALRQGGWNMDTTWFHVGKYRSSSAWDNANSWFNYATKQKHLKGVLPFNYLPTPPEYLAHLGDIAQYTATDRKTAQHSMVVTGWSRDEVLLTYHSRPFCNMPYSVLLSRLENHGAGRLFYALNVAS